jgi:hypothetical protein
MARVEKPWSVMGPSLGATKSDCTGALSPWACDKVEQGVGEPALTKVRGGIQQLRREAD